MARQWGEGHRVYFMHINKTGGTSFSAVARRAFRPDEVCPAGLVPQLLALGIERLQAFRYFSGHFGTGLFSLLGPDLDTIVLLRDPVDRAISQFNAHLSNPGTQFHAAIMARNGDLAACLSDPQLAAMLSNYQTRFLGHAVDLRPYAADPTLPRDGIQKLVMDAASRRPWEDLLAAACRQLERAAVVGVLERLDAAVRRLSDFLGVSAIDPPRLNISGESALYGTHRKVTRTDFPRDVIRHLEDLNRYDIALFETALRTAAA